MKKKICIRKIGNEGVDVNDLFFIAENTHSIGLKWIDLLTSHIQLYLDDICTSKSFDKLSLHVEEQEMKDKDGKEEKEKEKEKEEDHVVMSERNGFEEKTNQDQNNNDKNILIVD